MTARSSDLLRLPAHLHRQFWLSDLYALGEHEGIFDIDTQIANCRFDLGMPKQDLNGAQIDGLLVDEGCLRPAQRMCAIILRSQSDGSHPFIDKTSLAYWRALRCPDG